MTYMDKNGITRKGRAMRPPCSTTCPYYCRLNFDADERLKIFSNFWLLKNDEKKKFYIEFIDQIKPKRRYTIHKNNSRRSRSFIYYLLLDNVKLQVCKVFFLNTLGISSAPLYRLFNNKS